jgi:O-methyltransferase
MVDLRTRATTAAGAFLKSAHARRWFLKRSACDADRQLRTELLSRFHRVDTYICCEHDVREMLVLADYILGAPAGDLVECGCYLGGSSAKLSLVAAATGRKLYVCDSFEGLPASTAAEQQFETIDGKSNGFGAGQYAATLDVVRRNIENTGNIAVCEFVQGYFCNSLPHLAPRIEPAFVFSDADLISSTRDVLKWLWPRIVPGGRFWTHDANIPALCYGIMDNEWWMTELGQPAPLLFGAGYGMGLGAAAVAWAEKRAI